MKLSHLSFALVLTFASQAFAAMTDAQLIHAMRQDFEKYFISVKNPRLIFHWVDASDITPAGQYNSSVPTIGASFENYVNKQGSKIYRPRDTRDYDIEGPGLYLASDPVSTRSYGGQKSFGLIVGLVKPGAKIVSGDTNNVIAANILSEIQARGCTARGDYNSLLDVSGDVKCTKIKQLLVGADVSFADGRMYNYSNSILVEGCSKRSPFKEIAVPASRLRDYEGLDTFVAYSTRMFTKVMGFTHKTTVGNDALANEVLSYLKGLHVNNLASASYPIVSQEQISNPSIKAMARADIAKFSQKYIMGCNL